MATDAQALQLIPAQNLEHAQNPEHEAKENNESNEVELTLDQQFLHAAMEDNIEKMQELLAQGVNIDGVEEEHPPIVFAAFFGGIKAVRFLIDKGANVNKTSSMTASNHSVLQCLIINALQENNFNKYKPLMEYLLKHKADINHVDIFGRNAVQLASVGGNLEILSFLFENGAAIRQTDPFGNGISALLPLLLSCQIEELGENGEIHYDLNLPQFEQIQAAIIIWMSYGFDINYQPTMQMIPIADPDAPPQVLDLDDPEHIEPENPRAAPQNAIQHSIPPLSGYSPLMIACHLGHLPLVAFIISRGANVNQIGGYYGEETPLSIAAKENHFLLVEYLIENAGADPNPVFPATSSIFPSMILSPVHYALGNKNFLMMRYLIDKGSAAEPMDELLQTINFIDLPAESRNPGNLIFQSVMRLFDFANTGNFPAGITLSHLLAEGASLNQCTTLHSNTPLHLACNNNNVVAVRTIIEFLKGTPELYQFRILTAVNRENLTPFDIAAQKNMGIANVFRNYLQPMVDRYVFTIKNNPLYTFMPPEILQEMFTLAYGNMRQFAKTDNGIALIAEMFDLAARHHAILMQRASERSCVAPHFVECASDARHSVEHATAAGVRYSDACHDDTYYSDAAHVERKTTKEIDVLSEEDAKKNDEQIKITLGAGAGAADKPLIFSNFPSLPNLLSSQPSLGLSLEPTQIVRLASGNGPRPRDQNSPHPPL